jgi:hypothetical protein
MPLSEHALYVELGRLIEAIPYVFGWPPMPELHRWLGQAYALVVAANPSDEQDLKSATETLLSPIKEGEEDFEAATNAIISIVYRALAVAELRAPLEARGAFIPAGHGFDAFVAFGKVLGAAAKDVLMVDPYMDEKALTTFALLAVERVTVRLLADQAAHKPSLKPAAETWISQYGNERPLEARLAAPRSLHDRALIIDGSSAWVLTQSMNAFAARAPASIVRVDPETRALKIAAYADLWNEASSLL